MQRVTGVSRVRVKPAKVNPEDCGKEVPVNVMMRRGATRSPDSTSSSTPQPWHPTRSCHHADPTAKAMPCGTVRYPYFTQHHDNFVQLGQKVGVKPSGPQLQVLLLSFPLLSLHLVIARASVVAAFALVLVFFLVSQQRRSGSRRMRPPGIR